MSGLYKYLMFEEFQKLYFEGPEVKMPQFVVRKETLCPFQLEDIKEIIFWAISVMDSYILTWKFTHHCFTM